MDSSHSSRSSVVDVRSRILDHIRRSGRSPGERIETERALQEALGTSRSRVRDALAALEAQGIVTRRIGSGTYLARNLGITGSAAPSIEADQLSPARLMEARMTLEPSMLPIIVNNATNSDLKALEAILDAADAAKTSVEYEKRDTEFHYRLAASAHNALLLKFAEMIVEARRGTEWGRAKEKSSTVPNRRTYQNDHRKILEAIRNLDPEGAVTAMKDHLITIRNKLAGR